MTKEVHTLLKAWDIAFKSGDRVLYSMARADLKRGIKGGKKVYKRMIEDHFTDNNTRCVWQNASETTLFCQVAKMAKSERALSAFINAV